MSYSTHHTISVPYSGSVVTSYPASEHGGTKVVHYSGTEHVGITINVLTEPFDNSVDGTKKALTGVTGALTAAEAAQVAQLHASANKISQTVIAGFYGMLASEISSLASESSSSMSSVVGLIAQEGEQVQAIHRQMETDYAAIKQRYLRIFDDLDRELEQRIRQLDQPAFDLSTRGMEQVIAEPFDKEAAQAYVHAQDAQVTPLKLGCARAKSKAADAVDYLGTVCGYITDYERDVDSILHGAGEQELVFAPIVYTLQRDIDADRERVTVHGDVCSESKRVTQNVVRFVGNTPAEEWREPEARDRSAVDEEFRQRVDKYRQEAGGEDDSYRERVCAEIMKLYNGAQTQTTYR